MSLNRPPHLMAASSLLTLIDDISALLDDVAILAKVAAQKTTGVMGDDMALNAEQVAGVSTDRELPIVWAVAKGSFRNKVILVPAALGISAFFPAGILPLLMIGGVFLCYEGFEKVWHKLSHATEQDTAARAARLRGLVDPTVDLVAMERAKIAGAVRTDFILSAEIIVIALGTMSTQPIGRQVVALSIVAVAVTVLVYGLVAGIVKLDDLGLRLRRDAAPTDAAYRLGDWILAASPVLMKGLSVLGTAAMFMVGGGIVVHVIPALEHLAAAWSGAGGLRATVITTVLDAAVGVVVGGLCVLGVTTVKRFRTRPHAR